MLKGSLIYMLGVFLLLQGVSAFPRMRRDAVAVAHPHDNTVDHKDTSSSEECDDPRHQLYVVTILETLTLAKYTIDVARPLFTNVLKDLNALPTRSEALEANMTRMSDFLKKTENIKMFDESDETMKLFEEMIDFAEIMANLESMPDELELTKTLKKAFTDNGIDKVEENFMEHSSDMIKRFSKSFETYLTEVTEEQKKRDHKLIEWYNKLKSETDTEKKMEVFTDFFEVAEMKSK